MGLEEALRKSKIDEEVIENIMNVEYIKDSKNEKQDYTNFMAAALKKCEEVLDTETINKIMYDRACCKTGARLKNSREFAKEHKEKTLEEKLELLSQVKYMGKPFLNKEGHIETIAIGNHGWEMTCPCWRLGKKTPADDVMPLTYCKCCGGHFQFHYQKALGVKLELLEVTSSILASEGKEPCVFVFKIRA